MGLSGQSRVERDSEIASYARKVGKMRPPKVTSRHHPAAPKAAGPHPCTQMCQVQGRARTVCGSTVHGGVCPCPDC